MVDEQLVRQALASAVEAAVPGITCHTWEVALTSPDQVEPLGLKLGGVFRYAYVHGPRGNVSRLSANRGGVDTRQFDYQLCFCRGLTQDGAGYDQVRADAGAVIDYLASKPLTEIIDPAATGGGVRMEKAYELEHDRVIVEHVGLLERLTLSLQLSWRVRRAS